MGDVMNFQERIEDFIEQYSFRDDERTYTNGSMLIPVFRVKQAIEHYMSKWIPCSERLPEEDGIYLATLDGEIVGEDKPFSGLAEFENGKWIDDEEDYQCVLAWQPLPQPYQKGE